MAIRIVTDSTADLPVKLASEYGIEVVPLNVHFGDEVFKDGVEIWSDEFYHRLRNGVVFPTTSQPAPGEFLKAYQKTAKPGDTIISLHISQELSGTAGSARIAAEMLGREYQVKVIDSRSISMGLGIMAVKAARLAGLGTNPEIIVENISKWQKECALFFTVNSLEYLHRSGRIGKASTLLGSLLNIKPLLGIEDGIIVPVEKIRGNFQKVAFQMVENIYHRYSNSPLSVGVMHTEMPEAVGLLQEIAERRLKISELFTSIVGPVIGAHAGPNTIGIVAFPV